MRSDRGLIPGIAQGDPYHSATFLPSEYRTLCSKYQHYDEQLNPKSSISLRMPSTLAKCVVIIYAVNQSLFLDWTGQKMQKMND